MPAQKVSKEKLLKILLWVSIFVVSIIGVYVFKLVAEKTLVQVSNALKSVFIPFAIAFFLSFIIGPLATLFEEKLHMKRSASIIFAIFLGLIIIIGLLSFVMINLVVQMMSIFTSLFNMIDAQWIRAVIDAIQGFLDTYLNGSELSELINQLSSSGLSFDRVIELLGGLLAFVSNLTSSVFQAIFIIILTPVFLYYLIKEKEYIFRGINNIFPEKLQPHFEALGRRTDTSVRNYLKGQGIMIGLIASYFAIFLSILSFFVPGFGIEIAILFALIMGLFNIVPYVGAWIGLSLPIIFLLTKHLESVQPTDQQNIYMIAIITVVALQVVQQAIESVVQPLVLGSKVQIHPLLVLSSLIFFGGVFGFVGVLLAVPLAATIKSSLEYFRSLNQTKVKKTTKTSNEL
jgi:putative permease